VLYKRALLLLKATILHSHLQHSSDRRWGRERERERQTLFWLLLLLLLLPPPPRSSAKTSVILYDKKHLITQRIASSS
jgi:hypothetical protein